MKTIILLILAVIVFQIANAQQAYTTGGYQQIYWDWRPDIADSCYEFTFIRYMIKDSSFVINYPQKMNLFYWDDCNYGKNYINANWSTMTATNTPLHDTLYRVTPMAGISDTFCGFPIAYQQMNFAQILDPLRNKVVYKGLVYLPEKCKNWHFVVGRYYDLSDDRSAWVYLFSNVTDPTSIPPGVPYTNKLSNIDSLFYNNYDGITYNYGEGAIGVIACSFNNIDFPNNSSPRFLSPPIYEFQVQKQLEFNPAPYDPDHDSMFVSIPDTIVDGRYVLAPSGGVPPGFYIAPWSKTDSFGTPHSELFAPHLFYAPVPGQTGPNPHRYNPANPFDTDSTFNLNPNTGKNTFTAKSVMEPVLMYDVKDYRNNVFVSETFCINQFTIMLDGRPPSFMKIDTASLQGATFNNQGRLNSCAGYPVSFDAYVKLPSVIANGDLRVWTSADTTVPGNGACVVTGVGTDSVHLQFSWTPPPGTRGLYNVFVWAKDSNCLAPYQKYLQVYTWSFHVDSCNAPMEIVNVVEDNSVMIYPNPVNTQVSIISNEAAINEVKIYNTLSQLVYEKKAKGIKQLEINVKDLPNGMYLVNIDGKYLRKLVIQR